MANLHELTEPIPQGIPEDLRKPLENLQGNILHGHGRDRSVHIFLSFKHTHRAGVARWIRRLAKRTTSAQRQLEEAEQYRQYKIPGRLFINFFLSARGYRYFGLAPVHQPGFDDEAFLGGMAIAQPRLNDPCQEDWEETYRKEIDAMVLLADDNELFLLRETRRLLDSIKAHANICAIEHGRVRRNAHQESVEHFGYADSRSQPLFFQRDIEREKQEKDGTHVWDPSAGLDLVLVPDPYGREQCESHGKVVTYHYSGSYLVFRKLEQRVRAFKEREKDLAKALGLTGEDVERAGALVMGRFPDGTPVVLQRTAGRSAPIPNNFTYDDDPYGQKCPFHAHIRKVNPRQQGVPTIVRRGMTYGTRQREPQDKSALEELPTDGVGLLFMCYQRSIERQFEVLQYLWASDPHFPPDQEPGTDPVIGQPGAMGVGRQQWPARWGDPLKKTKPFDFHGFVNLKGGEYFFAPSLYFLKNLDPVLLKNLDRDGD